MLLPQVCTCAFSRSVLFAITVLFAKSNQRVHSALLISLLQALLVGTKLRIVAGEGGEGEVRPPQCLPLYSLQAGNLVEQAFEA